MAFRFNWPEFDTGFYDEAKIQLETALNKGNKPKNIVDHITVKELHMGSTPPELEILEVGELTTDKFRGIFKLTYAGDAYIVLQTKVQANPMHNKQPSDPRQRLFRPGILAADKPLVVPMLLRISDLKLRGIVVLVVSKTKGITLVFKNDPLESIIISSTFDSVTSVRNFLQREIEKQLRKLFQEDLPVMIHNLSVRHLQTKQEQQEQQERASSCSSSSIGSRTPITSSPISVNGLPPLSSSSSMFADDDRLSSLSCSLPQTPADTEFFEMPPPYIPQDFADLYPTVMDKPHHHHYGALGLRTSLPSSSSSSYCASEHDTYSQCMSLMEYGSLCSEDSSRSSIMAASTSIYDDDPENAPWYVMEGPEIPSLIAMDASAEPVPSFPQEIVLRPTENGLAARLAQLTSTHHTLSLLSPAVAHSICRSSPHNTMVATRQRRRRNKVPKRRIIRLSGF
ncbi:hypothetical protein K492DRAFT_152669 [Lichtheimia hyalospora FSU 10163]|nr:hypothetical protein K492DRAFT_152669 [Lichtheimia hyalospora FSU 10163]